MQAVAAERAVQAGLLPRQEVSRFYPPGSSPCNLFGLDRSAAGKDNRDGIRMVLDYSYLLAEKKNYHEESVFKPENLLRESRRQKNISQGPVPTVCVLDPDGDIHAMLTEQGKVFAVETWACYHTDLFSFDCSGTTVGIIPGVVGASFATLVAEQLKASGCRFIVSITSAGKLTNEIPCRYLLIVDSLRD